MRVSDQRADMRLPSGENAPGIRPAPTAPAAIRPAAIQPAAMEPAAVEPAAMERAQREPAQIVPTPGAAPRPSGPVTSPLIAGLPAPLRLERHGSGSAATTFVEQYMDREAAFFAVARDARSGLAFDGVSLDPKTHAMTGPRRLSAPSKECLDLAVLAKMLQGDPLARRLVPGKSSSAEAVRILTQKIAAYERFDRDYPGYGGFMPWIVIRENGDVAPADAYWEKHIPAVDNGEWLFGLLAVTQALRDSGNTALANRYEQRIARLRKSARKVFFDEGDSAVRGSAGISDHLSPNATYKSEGYVRDQHGVHESAMILEFVSLYSDPPLSRQQIDHIWSMTKMERVETPYGTTWRGFWGSAHEEWEYAMMPKRDLPEYDQLFRIRQHIRTQDARARNKVGLAASINPPNAGPYTADLGIPMIASEPVTDYPFYATYGVFPVLLAQHGTPGREGIAWLANELTPQHAVTSVGSAESVMNDGSAASPMKTIDGSMLIWLGLMGGIQDIMRSRLRADGVYTSYMEIIDREYRETFKAPLNEPSAFAAPRTP